MSGGALVVTVYTVLLIAIVSGIVTCACARSLRGPWTSRMLHVAAGPRGRGVGVSLRLGFSSSSSCKCR